MIKRKLRIILVSVVLAVIASGAWWEIVTKHQGLVVSLLPATPDLTTAPAILQNEIAAAEEQAHSRFGAVAGLAKLSRLYHANGFLNEAVQCYKGVEQLEPSEPRWLHFHAAILAGFGELEPARALWHRVVELAPDFLPARLRLGDCEFKSNRAGEAAAIYAAVLQHDPGNSYAVLGLARLDYEAQRWAKAQERLEQVVKQTDYILGYDLIVSLYEQTGQSEKARAIRAAHKASGAYRDVPDPWIDGIMDVCYDPYRLALTAGFMARDGDAAKSVHLLERAIELNPDNASLRFQLGTLSASQGHLTVAREQLERCVRLAPAFADGWARLSELQAQQGENSAAAQTLSKGLLSCPNSAGLHLMHASHLQQAGLNTQAINEYQEAIRLRPNEAEPYIRLSSFYIQLGQAAEAILILQESLEAEPDNPMALSTLAYYAISAHNEPSALQWLEKVRNQPRVQPEQVAKLLGAYQEQFGRPLR